MICWVDTNIRKQTFSSKKKLHCIFRRVACLCQTLCVSTSFLKIYVILYEVMLANKSIQLCHSSYNLLSDLMHSWVISGTSTNMWCGLAMQKYNFERLYICKDTKWQTCSCLIRCFLPFFSLHEDQFEMLILHFLFQVMLFHLYHSNNRINVSSTTV